MAKLASPVVKSATEYAANDAALVIAGISWVLTNCAIGIISFALKWVSANGMQAPTVSTNMWRVSFWALMLLHRCSARLHRLLPACDDGHRNRRTEQRCL